MSYCDDNTAESTVYLTHDNVVTIIPYSDFPERVIYDMSNVTKVVATADLTSSATTGDGYSANSVDDPSFVWFEETTLGNGDWRIYMRVGRFASIVAGEYNLRVVLEDPVNTAGIVVADGLRVDVIEIP